MTTSALPAPLRGKLTGDELQLAHDIANLRAFLASRFCPSYRAQALGAAWAQHQRRTAELAGLEARAIERHGCVTALLAAAGLPTS